MGEEKGISVNNGASRPQDKPIHLDIIYTEPEKSGRNVRRSPVGPQQTTSVEQTSWQLPPPHDRACNQVMSVTKELYCNMLCSALLNHDYQIALEGCNMNHHTTWKGPLSDYSNWALQLVLNTIKRFSTNDSFMLLSTNSLFFQPVTFPLEFS